ncbi:MAG: HD domain-containing protein [Deltaproteobacteria bacterium]|nr:HD domain-containing protein [Deltaproteobacteria bacterium]MBW2660690.1 HD domain-containing protein [Deltaproteobacteria bacterium]
MKKQFVSSIKAGDSVNDIFILSDKVLAQKRDGNNFLNITLSDKTGTIKGVMWDNIDETVAGITSGNFVNIRGNVSEYKGTLQLIVKSISQVSSDSVNPSDFLPATSRNIDDMFMHILKITGSIETACLKELFERFWSDDEFVSGFKTAPAAKKMHHAYIGGLLEHSLSMAILANKIVNHYKEYYKGINRDMLIAGAILHDIGKIREFNYKYSIDYSDQGRLLSHIVIGIEMIDEKLRKIKDFPEEQAILLKHMIVSHHGVREFGSPEPPKTIEAVLLNYIDEIDSKLNGIREFIASEDPNETWTSYHRLLERYFYTGKK